MLWNMDGSAAVFQMPGGLPVCVGWWGKILKLQILVFQQKKLFVVCEIKHSIKGKKNPKKQLLPALCPHQVNSTVCSLDQVVMPYMIYPTGHVKPAFSFWRGASVISEFVIEEIRSMTQTIPLHQQREAKYLLQWSNVLEVMFKVLRTTNIGFSGNHIPSPSSEMETRTEDGGGWHPRELRAFWGCCSSHFIWALCGIVLAIPTWFEVRVNPDTKADLAVKCAIVVSVFTFFLPKDP